MFSALGDACKARFQPGATRQADQSEATRKSRSDTSKANQRIAGEKTRTGSGDKKDGAIAWNDFS